jgi:DNA-binding transcriptional ArsR family regulator
MGESKISKYAAMFAALGHEARLSIIRLLLSAYPGGLFVGEIQQELEIPASTLSHHLDALRQESLVQQRREGKYLRYSVNSGGLKELLGFMLEECCTRSAVVPLESLRRKSPK